MDYDLESLSPDSSVAEALKLRQPGSQSPYAKSLSRFLGDDDSITNFVGRERTNPSDIRSTNRVAPETSTDVSSWWGNSEDLLFVAIFPLLYFDALAVKDALKHVLFQLHVADDLVDDSLGAYNLPAIAIERARLRRRTEHLESDIYRLLSYSCSQQS